MQDVKTAAVDEAEIVDIEEVAEEVALMRRAPRAMTLDQIAVRDPKSAVAIITNRINAIQAIWTAAVAATEPGDWTLFKDKEGTIVGLLRKSGCVKVRKYFGISIINIRPMNERTKAAEVEIYKSESGRCYGQIFGDAYCSITGETWPDIRGVRSMNEKFIGRDDNEADFAESCRTALENKGVRIAAAMVNVPLDRIAEAKGMTPAAFMARANRGAGFGTASEREAERAAAASATPAATATPTPPTPTANGAPAGPPADASATDASMPPPVITSVQIKTPVAISYSVMKGTPGMTNDQRSAMLREVCQSLGFEKVELCPIDKYDALVKAMRARVPGGDAR